MLVHLFIYFSLVVRAMGYQIKAVAVFSLSVLMGWPAQAVHIWDFTHEYAQ